MLQRENVRIVGPKARFTDRRSAGETLASHVSHHVAQYVEHDVVVLGLPRGGMLVAEPIARFLDAPLDFVITRKLLAPRQPHLAIGAVTERGRAFLNKPIIEALGISRDYLEQEIERERAQIMTETAAYREVLPATDWAGKTIIVADDNVITGSTMFATLRGLWVERPNNIILAIPIAPRDTLMALGDFADQVITLQAPTESFSSMQDYYEDYPAVSESDVLNILNSFVAVKT